MVWHFLLAFHKSMSWNNRKCSASVTFVSLVILYHIPAFHTVEVIFYIYIDFFLQYTYSLRKKLAKTFPLPIWIKVSHACFPVSRRNVYYQKQIRRVIDARTNKQTKSLVDKAGVQSTFSTTIKKEPCGLTSTLWLWPTFESKAPEQGQAKLVFATGITLRLIKTDKSKVSEFISIFYWSCSWITIRLQLELCVRLQ